MRTDTATLLLLLRGEKTTMPWCALYFRTEGSDPYVRLLRWRIIARPAEPNAATTNADVPAWWELDFRVETTALLVDLYDATLRRVELVASAHARRHLHAKGHSATTTLLSTEATYVHEVRSARLLEAATSHARRHVLLQVCELIGRRHLQRYKDVCPIGDLIDFQRLGPNL